MNANAEPPRLARTPSRAFLISIAVILVVGLPLAFWRMSAHRQEVIGLRRMATEMAVRNNLREISLSAEQFFLENKVRTVTLEQLVGPGKYMRQLTPVDGEDYRTLDLSQGVTPWKIVTASGITVVHSR
jgi:hypothetical protein